MFTFQRFIGCACTLGLACCMSVATPLHTLATDIVPVTDTWIPLPDAWDTVAPFYDNYNNALSSDSGVTITADNYDEYVFRSVIGNWVATNSAFGEDVSLNGIIDVLQADRDYYNYLINQIQVNPVNASYRFGQSAGASLRAFLGDMLEDTFGLTDIMTTSEAVGLDFPDGRVFVKLIESDTSTYYTYNNWVYFPSGTTYFTINGTGYNFRTDNSDGLWVSFGTSSNQYLVATFYTSTSQFTNDVFWGAGFTPYLGTKGWSSFSPFSAWPVGGYLYSPSQTSFSGSSGTACFTILNYLGLQPFSSTDDAFTSLYGNGTPSVEPEYTDPVVILNDDDPPIISPTSVYNDWSNISNYYYDTYNTDYVTYNTGDSIYNYTYYYNINNYSNDTPLWVVNGKNIPVYEFDRETFYDFSNTNYTVSEDLVFDSSFFDFVMEHIPIEIFTMLVTMLIASAFFLLFKH